MTLRGKTNGVLHPLVAEEKVVKGGGGRKVMVFFGQGTGSQPLSPGASFIFFLRGPLTLTLNDSRVGNKGAASTIFPFGDFTLGGGSGGFKRTGLNCSVYTFPEVFSSPVLTTALVTFVQT